MEKRRQASLLFVSRMIDVGFWLSEKLPDNGKAFCVLAKPAITCQNVVEVPL
jgi:hypothetical protein